MNKAGRGGAARWAKKTATLNEQTRAFEGFLAALERRDEAKRNVLTVLEDAYVERLVPEPRISAWSRLERWLKAYSPEMILKAFSAVEEKWVGGYLDNESALLNYIGGVLRSMAEEQQPTVQPQTRQHQLRGAAKPDHANANAAIHPPAQCVLQED